MTTNRTSNASQPSLVERLLASLGIAGGVLVLGAVVSGEMWLLTAAGVAFAVVGLGCALTALASWAGWLDDSATGRDT